MLPQLPAAAADSAANATLTVVSHTWVPRRVVRTDAAAGSSGGSSHTVAELEASVRSSLEAAAGSGGGVSVSVSVQVSGYRVSIPIGLQVLVHGHALAKAGRSYRTFSAFGHVLPL